MEHWEELAPGGLRFVYDDALFRPGTDTFLLSSLPRLKPGLRVCDLGCGTGLLSLLLLQRQPQLSVTGVEILPEAAALAQKAAVENGLSDRLTVLRADLRELQSHLAAGSFDLVVSNPPYFAAGSGAGSPDHARRTARSEDSCTLEDVCSAAAQLLRWGGSFCLVHRPDRLTDLLCALRAAKIEPKRLRFVCKAEGCAPSLLLLEARRGGNPGLTIDAPLLLQTPDGIPSAEIDAIYFRTTPTTEETL